MAAKRTIRTAAQRLEDNRKERIKLEDQAKKQAVELRTQAINWFKRASELDSKAHGALEKADGLLATVELDPDTFWIEQGEELWLDQAITPAAEQD